MEKSLKALEGRRVRIVNIDLCGQVVSNRIHRVDEVESVGENDIYRLDVSRRGEGSKRVSYYIYLLENQVESLIRGERVYDDLIGVVCPL